MQQHELFPLPEVVTLVHGVSRQEVTYTLYPPNCYAMAALEERYGIGFRDFFLGGKIVKEEGRPVIERTDEDGSPVYLRDGNGIQWGDANHIAFLLWLFAHQGNKDLTEESVKEQVNLYNFNKAAEAVQKAIAKARPTADQNEELKNGSGQEQAS